jgi:hypothetical protein
MIVVLSRRQILGIGLQLQWLGAMLLLIHIQYNFSRYLLIHNAH